MSELERALAAKKFVVTVEIDPPRGTDLAPLLGLARSLAGRVDAVVVSDNHRASPRLSPVLAAARLDGGGPEVVLTLTCRDRNRLALTSEMLAAGAAGVRNLLLVSGDYTSLGDHPGAKPVYDLDSVQALQLAAGLAQGRDLAGAELAGAPAFFLGAALAPAAAPLPPQVIKFRKKLMAGARFFITQPLNSIEALRGFLEQAGQPAPPVIAGVQASDPAGREQAAALFREIKASGLAAGVHLSMPAAQDQLPDLLEACGI